MRRSRLARWLPVLMGGGGVSASTLLTDLVAYWKLDEAEGGSRQDSVGTHHLTENSTDATGVAAGAGLISGGMLPLGTNKEYLSCAATAALLGGDRDWCFDGWFKMADRTASYELFSKGTSRGSAGAVDYRLFAASLSVSFRVSNGTDIAHVDLGDTPVNDTWTYFYAYHDATNNKIGGALNNAALAAPTDFTASGAHNPAGDFRLGISSVADLPLTGGLDEVARWNRLLTVDERLARWNGGSGLCIPFLGSQIWTEADRPVFSGTFTYSSSIEA